MPFTCVVLIASPLARRSHSCAACFCGRLIREWATQRRRGSALTATRPEGVGTPTHRRAAAPCWRYGRRHHGTPGPRAGASPGLPVGGGVRGVRRGRRRGGARGRGPGGVRRGG